MEKSAKKVLIVGGVAAGASTAARLRRLDESAEIILLERGPHISFANCGLPYYIGGVISKRTQLLVMPEQTMRSRFNVDVRVNSEAVEILRDEKKLRIKDLATGKEYQENYDILVLAPGSSPMLPPIQGVRGENVFTLWSLADTDKIKDYLTNNNPKSAVVVGGGFVGLELVENLRHLGIEVSLVEMLPQVMPNVDPDIAAVLHQELEQHGVKLYLNSAVAAISDQNGGKSVALQDGRAIQTDLVLMCAGVLPNSELAKQAGLALNQRGGIVVNSYLRTDDPAIYALGDVIEVTNIVDGKKAMIPLAGPANKQGRICANNIAGQPEQYEGSMGSSVAKVFDQTVAGTGMNRKQLERDGKILEQDFFMVHTHAFSHATYYPGAEQISIKLYYTANGTILGAQAVGREGVEKRIDVIATVMRLNGKVSDLTKLELCYAPPYSSAKDPVNMLGFMAENQQRGLVRFIQPDQLAAIPTQTMTILDVREQAEVQAGGVKNAVHIPLGQLRERLSELDPSKKIIIVCAVGLRAYIGAGILRQHGFSDCAVYSGGYASYRRAILD